MKKLLFLLSLTFMAVLINAQSVKWVRSDGGIAGGQEIRDLAVDPAGFIYAIGRFSGNLTVNGVPVNTRGSNDAFITKYTPAGELIWIKTIGGAGSADLGFQIETDQHGKVYASVFSNSSPFFVADSVLQSAVLGILRFDSSGRFEKVILSGMQVYNMKIYQNSIYVRNNSNAILKLSLDGVVAWNKSITGSVTLNNILLTIPQTSLDITPQGNLIFSQSCSGNYTYDGVTVTSSSGRYLIASLADTNSNLIRNYTWGENQGTTMSARKAIVDENNNVYLAAGFLSTYSNVFGSGIIQHLLPGSSYHAILKFNSAGIPQWVYNITCSNSESYFYDLEFDKEDNLAMLGMYSDITSLGAFQFPTNGANGNIFSATINPNGQLLTAMGFGSHNSTDRASDFQLLADSSFVLGGFTNNAAPVRYGCISSVTPGFMVMKYSYEAPPMPDVSFTALREQRKVFFASNVTNTTSVSWDFGDGTTSTQRNPVHTYTTPGNFNVRLIGQNSCGADTATAQILYNGIQKILPEKIANNQFQVVVAKGGFPFTTAQMILKRGTHILQSESVAVSDSGVLQANFLLSNEPLGLYDVIINSGSFTDTLKNGVELEAENDAELTLQITGPQVRLVNRFQRYQIKVSNPGNINKFAVPVMIAIHPKNEIARLSNFIITDSIGNVVRDSAFTHDFIMVRDSVSGDSLWMSYLIIPAVVAQSSETIEFYMRGTTLGDKPLFAILLKPFFTNAQLVQIGLARTESSCDFLADPVVCVLDLLNQAPGASCLTSALSFGCAIGNLGRDAVGNRNRKGDVSKYMADCFNFIADVAGILTCEAGGAAKEKAKEVAEDVFLEVLGTVFGISAAVANGDIPDVPFQVIGLPVTFPGSCVQTFTTPKKNLKDWLIKDVSSMDPNDKTGPVGLTANNYFDGQSNMQYLIRFENISTATAPASEVEIVDTLDAAFFDVRSLRFTGFGFADSSYQVLNATESYVQEIDLRPAKNTIVRFSAKLDTVVNSINWKFESLDPTNRDLVSDPNDGFLNPNQTSPEGEGFVSFSISPTPNRTHLQQVSNRAKIVFDENAPIFTNDWLNTVDKEKPSSHVLPLPAVLNDTAFTVKWTGNDPHAGMMAYDIYVTINDTLTRLLLKNTRADSIQLRGNFGNTYKFYSVAIDQVGNTEDPPGVPDAVITLSAPLPLTLLSFNGSRQNHDAVLQWRTENETNVSHFEVQRSTNGTDFITAGRVTAGGNFYMLTDPGIFNTHPVVYYRLKSIDIDGRFTFSAILKLSRQENGLLTFFPNPAKDQLVIGGLKRGGVLRIFSADGRLVQQTAVTTQTMIIDMMGYTSGIYWLQYASDGEMQTQKILKQ